MRKLILSLTAAGAALAVAAPAAAQYYQGQPAYGYQQPYGYQPNYGYGAGYGQAASLKVRIDNVERSADMLRARHALSRERAHGIKNEARRLEMRLATAARYGGSGYALNDVAYGVSRLEQKLQRSAYRAHGYGYGNNYGYGSPYGYNQGQYGSYGGNWNSDRDDDDDGDGDHRWGGHDRDGDDD